MVKPQWWQHRTGAAERRYPTCKVMSGSQEDIPHIQIQEQRSSGDTPCPRSGAVACWSSHEEKPHVQGKRNPSKTIGAERGHQRADRLKPQSQPTRHLITQTTALSNSMKLSHAMWGHTRPTGHGREF